MGVRIRTGPARNRNRGAWDRRITLNLRDLLLAAPAGSRPILGLDPGIRTGVKAAVVDSTGKLLATDTLYPFQPKNDVRGAVLYAANMFLQRDVKVVNVMANFADLVAGQVQAMLGTVSTVLPFVQAGLDALVAGAAGVEPGAQAVGALRFQVTEEQARHQACHGGGRGRVARVAARDQAVEERVVAHRLREGADLVEGGTVGDQTVAGDPDVGRLHAHKAAERCRLSN